jgi:hypothetical protein
MKSPARKNKDLLPLRPVVSMAQINVIAALKYKVAEPKLFVSAPAPAQTFKYFDFQSRS